MKNKKSINVKDFNTTLIVKKKEVNEWLHYPDSNNKQTDFNQIQQQFLAKIKRRYSRGNRYLQSSSLSRERPKQDLNFIVEGKRQNSPSLSEISQARPIKKQKCAAKNQQKQLENQVRAKKENARKMKIIKSFIQAEMKSYNIDLKQQQQKVGQLLNLSDKRILQLNQKTLSPFQISIRKKHINKIKLKIHSLGSIVKNQQKELKDRYSGKTVHKKIQANKFLIYKNDRKTCISQNSQDPNKLNLNQFISKSIQLPVTQVAEGAKSKRLRQSTQTKHKSLHYYQ